MKAEDIEKFKARQIKYCAYHYYGIEFGADNRGFITREKYNGGKFTIRCLDGLTIGNGYGGFDSFDFGKLVNAILDTNQNRQIFVFEKLEEFERWLFTGETNIQGIKSRKQA